MTLVPPVWTPAGPCQYTAVPEQMTDVSKAMLETDSITPRVLPHLPLRPPSTVHCYWITHVYQEELLKPNRINRILSPRWFKPQMPEFVTNTGSSSEKTIWAEVGNYYSSVSHFQCEEPSESQLKHLFFPLIANSTQSEESDIYFLIHLQKYVEYKSNRVSKRVYQNIDWISLCYFLLKCHVCFKMPTDQQRKIALNSIIIIKLKLFG